MMWYGKEHGRAFWIRRLPFILLAVAAFVFIFGYVVMFLWNSILPGLLGVGTITYWQALGILVLSKILFGGFRGGHGHHHCNGHRHEWNEKWMHMNPEERDKMKADWRERCMHPSKDV